MWGVLACFVRLLGAWTFREHPLFSAPLVDGRFYLAWADRMALHGPFVDAPFTMSPLFAWFWWGLKNLGLSEGWGLRGVLSVIGGVNIGLLCFLSQVLGGRRAGWVMGVLGVFCLPLMMADLNLMKTGLGVMLYLAALVTLVRGIYCIAPTDRTFAGIFFLSGFLFGLAALVREPLVLTGLALLVFAAWMLRKKFALRILLLGVAGLFLPLSINAFGQWRWGVSASGQQAGKGRSFVFLTAAGGEALYLGLGPESTGTFNLPGFARPDPAVQHTDFQAEARRRTGLKLSASQADDFWRNQAIGFAVAHPRRTFWLMVNKLRLIVNLREIPSDLSLLAWRQEVPFLRIFLVSWWLWIPLGAGGMFVFWKTSFPARLLALAALLGVLGLLPFFVYDRFRLLALLPLLPLAAAFLADFRAWPKKPWAVLLMGCFLFLTWLDREKVRLDPQPGYDQKLLADTALLAGQKKLAWRHYRLLSTHPLYGADALLQMGGMAMSAGHLGVAEKFFVKALGREPDHAEATANLAMIYAQTKRRGMALVWFQKALALSPQNPALWRAVGIFMLEEKKYAAARASFDRALALRGGGDEDLLRKLIFSAIKAGEKETARRYIDALRQISPEQGSRAMAQWQKAFGP